MTPFGGGDHCPGPYTSLANECPRQACADMYTRKYSFRHLKAKKEKEKIKEQDLEFPANTSNGLVSFRFSGIPMKHDEARRLRLVPGCRWRTAVRAR